MTRWRPKPKHSSAKLRRTERGISNDDGKLQWHFFSIPQGDSGMLRHSGRRQIASLNLPFAAGEIEIYISVVMVLIHGIDPRDVTCHHHHHRTQSPLLINDTHTAQWTVQLLEPRLEFNRNLLTILTTPITSSIFFFNKEIVQIIYIENCDWFCHSTCFHYSKHWNLLIIYYYCD